MVFLRSLVLEGGRRGRGGSNEREGRRRECKRDAMKGGRALIVRVTIPSSTLEDNDFLNYLPHHRNES